MYVGVRWTTHKHIHSHTHTYTHRSTLRSPLMASGRPLQGRPNCCSFQLQPRQRAIPRSVLCSNWADFIFMRENCWQYINTTLSSSLWGRFHSRQPKRMNPGSALPVFGNVRKMTWLHGGGNAGKKSSKQIRDKIFIIAYGFTQRDRGCVWRSGCCLCMCLCVCVFAAPAVCEPLSSGLQSWLYSIGLCSSNTTKEVTQSCFIIMSRSACIEFGRFCLHRQMGLNKPKSSLRIMSAERFFFSVVQTLTEGVCIQKECHLCLRVQELWAV